MTKANFNSPSPLWALLGRLALIALIPVLMYFWGTAIIYNLTNFWNVFTPAKANQFSQDLEPPLAAPVLASLPRAVKEDRLEISGFTKEGLAVTLFVDGQAFATTRAGKSGEFSFENVSLAEGNNEIYAKATGNQKVESPASAVVSVKYLKKPPFLEVINLPEKTDLHQKESLFAIKGRTDPDASLTINGSQVFVEGGGNFSYPFPLLDGENKISLEALDEAGNKTTLERTVNFTRQP